MHPNPRKTRSVRHLGQVDIGALRDEVMKIPEALWDAENADKPNKFEALDKTRHIVFRFVDSTRDWRQSYDRPLWAEWRPRIEPIMAQVTEEYGYQRSMYPRVMLARMAPGGVIKMHIDANPAAKWPHKIHVPLLTNDRVTFFIDGVGYHFVEGEAVEVNNLGAHGVRNEGNTDRIHLIFEYYDLDQPDPEWIKTLTG